MSIYTHQHIEYCMISFFVKELNSLSFFFVVDHHCPRLSVMKKSRLIFLWLWFIWGPLQLVQILRGTCPVWEGLLCCSVVFLAGVMRCFVEGQQKMMLTLGYLRKDVGGFWVWNYEIVEQTHRSVFCRGVWCLPPKHGFPNTFASNLACVFPDHPFCCNKKSSSHKVPQPPSHGPLHPQKSGVSRLLFLGNKMLLRLETC